MWKYLVIFAVVLGLAVYVARQDERAAQEGTQKPAALDNNAIPAKADENHPLENIPNPERHTPSWFGFFRWPNGTTTWAIILTLMAIAEQTKQTAKAAEATQETTKLMEKTIVLQFRPKLIIRKVSLRDGTTIPTIGVQDAYPWAIDYVVANIGGSRATIKRSGFEFTAFDKGFPAKLPYKMQEPTEFVHIEAGEEREFSIPIDRNLTNLFRILGVRGPYLSGQKIGYTYFWGCAQYSDDKGIIRNIAVCRHYETDNGKFKAIDDSDYEYAD